MIQLHDNAGNTVYPVAYLINEYEDILYDYSAPFHTGSEIMDASKKDKNHDGLKDIMLIKDFNDPDIDPIEWIFFQMEDGMFYRSRLECN